MSSDPIADMLIRLKHAAATGKPVVSVVYSKLKLGIAEVLQKSGFIKSVAKRGKKGKQIIEIELIPDSSNRLSIAGVRRISKPSRRVYRSSRDLQSLRQGGGQIILSTPRGVLTDASARKEKVGGEALFAIW